MEDKKNQALADRAETAIASEETQDSDDEPLDKNVKLMSPTRMVVRRFFRSKLSIIGLSMLLVLFIFCWVGPLVFTTWGETDIDQNGRVKEEERVITYEVDGVTYSFKQVVETPQTLNNLAKPDENHPLGTDVNGYDVFVRLMYGGQISLAISFIAVFVVAAIGIVMGGIAGYFGGVVDTVIMRVCDVLMCLPGFPILLIIGTMLTSLGVKSRDNIYYLMGYLALFSWPGTARLVRGQILSLREQEYMVAAEAMGYSVPRRIFKHLVPNVMPQLIVSMTLSLGSMILYEASLSFLGLGVLPPYASWGSMINGARDANVLVNYFNVWGPPGICIILAVLGFNFIGDGLRDALDPKMRR